MAFWDKEEVLKTVKKNKSENIEARRCFKCDKTYIDIRVLKVDTEGEFHPTSKGVAVPEEVWAELIKWEK